MINRISTRAGTLAYAVACVIASGASGAHAQQQRNESLRLEEVVVTATKRESRVEDIPIAVSTIGSDAIRTRGLDRFEDYIATVPGVQYNPGGSVYNAVISMRGVNDPGAENGLTQAPVAVYLDETPLTLSQGALNLDYSLFGVEQITVKGSAQHPLRRLFTRRYAQARDAYALRHRKSL